MEKLRQAAYTSIGRGVAFAGLGIFVVMVGLSFDPVLSLRSGGVLALMLLAGLLLRAQHVQRTDYRHTEAWLLIDRAERPDAATASYLTVALREACIWFARWTAGAAAVIWVVAVLLSLFGLGHSQA